MEMASSDDIAYLRMLFSPFDTRISAVDPEKISRMHKLFLGQERGIVHPTLIYRYLTESTPLPKSGYDMIVELLTVGE
ncbi:hypothetical protein L3V77_24165 [Vibrio sp. DW001]|uniref:hypothetical protein n=1 Tax=Vibrio sp. DW001 TaxID=2912315 RepID=UPI0023B12638|nr:hypothetical protein [Vibrio sp. DW001]WED29031.1 hypothetical protein L3V77_24165 [Vibrio sp. DW001]